MKYLLKSEKVEINPEKVTVTANKRVVTVTGPRGTLTRSFKHLDVDINIEDDTVKVDCWFANRKAASLVQTVCSHIRNMMTGVILGYEYHMKLCYAHFPVNVVIPAEKNSIEIRNFLGEKRVRRIAMLEGVTIEKAENAKDELVLQGNDVELVSRSAALISQSCGIRNKDIRKFLDGIYVSETKYVVDEDEEEDE
jgi:large subunit ribosomal protein L9e